MSFYAGSRAEPRAGDVVQCLVSYYSTLHTAQIVTVDRVEDGCIVIRNNGPYGSSPYRPGNFQLVRRAKQEKAVMLHIAVRITNPSGTHFDADHIATNFTEFPIMVDVSADALKQKIRDAIARNPNERWLICSGNTIGEHATPPVRFRAV